LRRSSRAEGETARTAAPSGIGDLARPLMSHQDRQQEGSNPMQSMQQPRAGTVPAQMERRHASELAAIARTTTNTHELQAAVRELELRAEMLARLAPREWIDYADVYGVREAIERARVAGGFRVAR
jgi:hypothetical protein